MNEALQWRSNFTRDGKYFAYSTGGTARRGPVKLRRAEDARIMLEEAERAGVPLAMLPSIAARMDVVIAEGHGAEDWTVLAKDAL